MEIKIDNIKIDKRIRKNTDNIEDLMESMDKLGQLSSIVVNSKLHLIAGHRRLESAKRLGWKYINAVIIETNDKADLLEIEIAENIHRSDFTPEELSYAYKKLSKLKRKNIFKRFLLWVSDLFKKIFRK